MDQGPDEPRAELTAATPEAIREAIAHTREQLASHLASLKDHLLTEPDPSTGDETTMPTKKSTRRTTENSRRGETKAKSESKPAAPKRKASPSAESNGSKKSELKSGSSKTSASASKNGATARAKKPKGTVEKIVDKAGEALDTMLAGAVVGAVSAAAETLKPSTPEKPKAKAQKSGKKAAGSPTVEVLGEIAPELAAGALTGAAKALIPAAETPATKKTAKKKS